MSINNSSNNLVTGGHRQQKDSWFVPKAFAFPRELLALKEGTFERAIVRQHSLDYFLRQSKI
jgi:hypothetical protein